MPDENNIPQDEQQQEQAAGAAEQQSVAKPADGPRFPRLEAALARQDAAARGASAAAAAPAAKPAAGAAKPANAPSKAATVAHALKLREKEAALAQRATALEETEAKLAQLRELKGKLDGGDRIGFLRSLAGSDAEFYALISEAATHAAGVREKDPAVAATALPAAVQRELAELRAAVAELPGLKKTLETFQGERTKALQGLQLEEQTRKAEAVWTDGWKQAEAVAAELPHVIITGDSPEAKAAQEEARAMVDARFLELAQAERTRTRAPVSEDKARALVLQAARDVNGRLAKLLKTGAGPGNVTQGRPTAAPRATAQQPGTSVGQGTGRPKALPTTAGEPAPVKLRNLSDQQIRKLAAEKLAAKHPEWG